MSNRRPGRSPCIAILFVALLLEGCRPASTAVAPPSAAEAEPIDTIAVQERGVPIASTQAATTGTADAPPTVRAASVVVTAATGNLFIRRGPDLAFNPISVLTKGQTAMAKGRDVLGDWLLVPVPGDPGRDGWISIMSEFTTVAGDVEALGEVEPSTWPELAFVRNCTHNQMVLNPGGLLLPPVDSFPENDVRVNPGSYTVVDVDVDEYPQVMRLEIQEGVAVDIVFDGTGEKSKCTAR